MQSIMPQRDFLFATWEGGGNMPPTLTVIRKLIERGHRVRLLSDACNRQEAESIGAEFVAYRHAPSRPDKSAASDLMRDWEAVSPQDGFARVLDKIMCGPALGYAQDVLRELDRKPADAIVSSEMLIGVMAAAEARQQKLALLTANLSLYPIPGIPPFGPGLLPAANAEDRRMQADMAIAVRAMFNSGLPAVNAARVALGLAPAADLLDHIERADRIFLGTSKAFDFEAEQLPANIRYIGPQLDDPTWAEPWVSPWREDDNRPLVVVAFSTTFQDHAGTMQRVIDALAGMPVRGLVTLGAALDESEIIGAANVVIRKSAPHGELMREAAVVITHAGHGTVIRALVHKVPLLCLPMGRDQHDNTARVVARGAGLELRPSAAPGEIAGTLHRLLGEPSFRMSAGRLGDAVAFEAANSPIVEELESLAYSSAGTVNCSAAA